MDGRLRASAVAAGALVGIVLASPSAASASTIYPPADSCTTTPATAAPGGSIAFACTADTFSADERVTITVTGENGTTAQIGMVRSAISTASGIARSADDGSLASVEIVLPSDATGIYNIAAVSPTSAGGTAAVTVANADGLPTTGLDRGALLGLWIGGGALVAAGAALALAAVARRRRDID